MATARFTDDCVECTRPVCHGQLYRVVGGNSRLRHLHCTDCGGPGLHYHVRDDSTGPLYLSPLRRTVACCQAVACCVAITASDARPSLRRLAGREG